VHFCLLRKKEIVIKNLLIVPARSGSKRIKDKNIRHLQDVPLLLYTLALAKNIGFFDEIQVSTDESNIAQIASSVGFQVNRLRPKDISHDLSYDIEFVLDVIKNLSSPEFDLVWILRPTNPFRSEKMLFQALQLFQKNFHNIDSIRGVSLCTEHPYKMWQIQEELMSPILESSSKMQPPGHDSPYQRLPKYYVQNSSLEVLRYDFVLKNKRTSGLRVMPYITEGYEGFDLNTEDDWNMANFLIQKGLAKLPSLEILRQKKGV
jgi:N-acylneuraminate cytidylyltransferase